LLLVQQSAVRCCVCSELDLVLGAETCHRLGVHASTSLTLTAPVGTRTEHGRRIARTSSQHWLSTRVGLEPAGQQKTRYSSGHEGDQQEQHTPDAHEDELQRLGGAHARDAAGTDADADGDPHTPCLQTQAHKHRPVVVVCLREHCECLAAADLLGEPVNDESSLLPATRRSARPCCEPACAICPHHVFPPGR
jgi:hypothetical protein